MLYFPILSWKKPFNACQKITSSKKAFLKAKSYRSASLLCAKVNENRRKRVETTVSQWPYETSVLLHFLQNEVVMVRTELEKLIIFHNGPSGFIFFCSLLTVATRTYLANLPLQPFSDAYECHLAIVALLINQFQR